MSKIVKVMSLGRINLGKNGNKYIWGCGWVNDDVRTYSDLRTSIPFVLCYLQAAALPKHNRVL
jgi:hypothetical protein